MTKKEAREIIMTATQAAMAEYDSAAHMSTDDIRRLGRASMTALDVYLQGRTMYVNNYIASTITQDIRDAAV